jgi:hypothetical protein
VRVSDRLALGVHEIDAGAATVSPAPTFAPGGYFRNVVGAEFPTLD